MLTTDELARLREFLAKSRTLTHCAPDSECVRDENDWIAEFHSSAEAALVAAAVNALPELLRMYEAVMAAPEARIVIDTGDLLVDEEAMPEEAAAALWRLAYDDTTFRLVPLATAKEPDNG